MIRILFLAGFILYSLAANIAVREYSNDDSETLISLVRSATELENEQNYEYDQIDYEPACNWMNNENMNYEPSPQEVNECKAKEEQHACKEFDIAQCSNQECLLGYETNYLGCIVSCECKQEGLLEGDIMVDRNQITDVKALYGLSPFSRAASRYLRRWNTIPKGDGTYRIPYEISETLKRNQRAVKAIREAMDAYSDQTCLRFEPRNQETDYLFFIQGRGCYSYVGRQTRKQPISIGRGCEYKGTVMHELMHAMGFWHEHSRPDRDNFVEIRMQNINPRMAYNFRKLAQYKVDSMGSPYDVGSIMQYGGYSFSKNRKPTIIDRKTGQPVRRQRRGFSTEDAKQLNMMYKCGQ